MLPSTQSHYYVHCLDPASGRTLWKGEFPHFKGRLIEATGDRVVVSYGETWCYSRAGRLLWKCDWHAARPALAKNSLTDGQALYTLMAERKSDRFSFVAMELADGRIRWQLPATAGQAVVGVDLGLVFVERNGALEALDSATGREVWKRKLTYADRVAVGPGLIATELTERGEILLLDSATGQDYRRYRVPSDDGRVNRLSFQGSRVYGIAGHRDVFCIDTSRSEPYPAWQTSLPGRVRSIAVTTHRICVSHGPASQPQGEVLDLEGKPTGSFDGFDYTLAQVDDFALGASGSEQICYDARSRKSLWRREFSLKGKAGGDVFYVFGR